MRACEQAPGLNMLQHGQSVHEQYLALITELQQGLGEPSLLTIWQKIQRTLPPPEVLKKYHVYHDCGKHLCLEICADGKRHFPNHAKISAEQYRCIFPDDGFTAQLIDRDMDFHTCRGDEILQLWKSPLAPALYLTAWAEINANAEMFGGRESQSYKIKKSRLIQAGKKFINM